MSTPPQSRSPSLQPADSGESVDDVSVDFKECAALPVVPSPVVLDPRSPRRTKWTVLLVPLILMLITASTRYVTHPIALDVLSDSPPPSDWHTWSTTLTDWRPHKRHPQADTGSPSASPSSSSPTSAGGIVFPTTSPSGSSSGASASVTPSTTPPADQALPTIPSSPPALPTPFPQPLDAMSQNFTTQSCYNFLLNMTNTEAFRSCRPFSLLLQSSEAFIQQAQDNVTGLNDILWGTCNTDLSGPQCVTNMAWFASTLQTECSEDLSQQNTQAVSTLIGLQAFSLMNATGCLADPLTNVYCYIEAVHNSNPSDLYFFQLPLGVSLPNNTTPSCSACTKSLMALYAPFSGNLTGLKETYAAAGQIAEAKCGQGYAPTQAVATSSAARSRQWSWAAALVLTAAALSVVF